MSAWTHIVEHSSANFDAPFSWKDCMLVSMKKLAISLLAMAISISILIALEHRWQYSDQSPECLGVWKLCLAFAGSGVAVTGVDWVFGGSDETSISRGKGTRVLSSFPSNASIRRGLTSVFFLRYAVRRANL